MGNPAFRKQEGRSLLNVEINWADIQDKPNGIDETLACLKSIRDAVSAFVSEHGEGGLLPSDTLAKVKAAVNALAVEPLKSVPQSKFPPLLRGNFGETDSLETILCTEYLTGGTVLQSVMSRMELDDASRIDDFQSVSQ